MKSYEQVLAKSCHMTILSNLVNMKPSEIVLYINIYAFTPKAILVDCGGHPVVLASHVCQIKCKQEDMRRVSETKHFGYSFDKGSSSLFITYRDEAPAMYKT